MTRSNFSKKGTKDKIIILLTICIVIVTILFFILPMIILGDRYAFVIHDGLDSYPAVVEMMYKNHLAFHFNCPMPVMNGMPGNYFSGYTFYELVGGLFGFKWQQIINRFVGIVIGLFSMKILMKKLFPVEKILSDSIINLCALSYAVMPSAPNRTIAFAILPFMIFVFIIMRTETISKKKVFLLVFFPFFSAFSTVTIFVLVIWFVYTTIEAFIKRKINRQLAVSLAIMSISTALVNSNVIWIALNVEKTNRRLLANGMLYQEFSITNFKEYLIHGQYHAPTLASYIIIPVVFIFFVWGIIKKTYKIIAYISAGLLFWVMSAFLMTFQEAGLRTGILLIDGVSWGRIVGWTRLVWILLIGLLVYEVEKISFAHVFTTEKTIRALRGIVLGIGVVLIIYILFGDTGFPDINTYYLPPIYGKMLELVRWFALIFFCASLFSGIKQKLIVSIYVVMIVHIVYTATSATIYNDTSSSVWFALHHSHSDSAITVGEFFSEELFSEIKSDIGYNNEGVAAYGFHPSVLMYNGYNTIDGYLTVHSMEYQEKFREIISPALDIYPEWKTYYDNWGGRMYLYGSLSYIPTINKDVLAEPLYIDVNKFKSYGGKYIFSRALISNADELGISFINDYDNDSSLYHIFLYTVNDD